MSYQECIAERRESKMTKTVKKGYVMPVIIMSNIVHCLQQNYKP